MTAFRRRPSSLLAHLAGRLTDRTETLATEALGYILSQSKPAREALRELVGAEVGAINYVKTEVAGEQAERVDLVGYEREGGAERVLIEAKFWAGLTEHQPNSYLARLEPSDDARTPAILLFVAPEARLETLWPEVLRRGREAGVALSETDSAKHRATVEGGPHRLMLKSWRALLQAMSASASDAGDSAAERDILQLLALCEGEDEAAFIPIRHGEFGPDIPRRLLNLQRLIDDATERARERGFCETSGLKVTPQTYGYGRYVRLGSANGVWAEAWLGVDYRKWAREAETPIWLNFVATKGSPYLSLAAVRSRVGYSYFYFPLLAGVEYDAVLDQLVDQLQWIALGLAGND